MSIPKEPRQQMINIMYLVLTALLALNISAEILNAFKMLNKSIDNSNVSADQKVGDSMKRFAASVEKDPFGKPYYDIAVEAEKIGTDYSSYISTLMADMTKMSNGPEFANETELKNDREKETTTRVLVEEGKAAELKDKLNEAKNKFIGLFDLTKKKSDGTPMFSDADVASLKQAIAIEDYSLPQVDEHGKETTWERKTFYQMPIAPAITLINKMNNDVKATTAAVVDKLYKKVNEADIVIDNYVVGVAPNGTKFIQGEEFMADVFLSASSSQQKPSISVNGSGMPLDAQGIAHYKSGVLNSTGERSFNFVINYKDVHGVNKTVNETRKITVVPPPDHVAVVSPTKMNVFYIGVDNPVAASITGIAASATNASMSGGTISPNGSGQYTVRVQTPGKATITLSGKNQLGKTVSLNSEFRVKRIPDPTPEVGGKSGGTMGTGEWKAQQAVFAMLKDFDFDAKFNVIGFEMTLVEKGQDLQICNNNGGRFEGTCATYQQKAKVGNIYYFDNIKAKGPDGSTRTLPSISFKIK